MGHTLRATTLVQWLGIGAAVGGLSGVASAAFLWLLESATAIRVGHPGLIYALPLAGFVVGLIYERFGGSIAAGNNLVIDTIHDQGPQIPTRMAPMVLIGTVLTHLFGGSAGREGTAVQMGASLADALAHQTRASRKLRRHFLAAGVAGGFGSVFGTPIAGAFFGMEFVVLGRMDTAALLPALTAALVGDRVTRWLGIRHAAYPQVAAWELDVFAVGKLLVLAAAAALASVAFVELTHAIKKQFGAHVPRLPWRMAIGGCLVVLLYLAVGTDAYLGLGVPGIMRAFVDPQQPVSAFVLKLVFTAVTLGAGFLGGEVTPLFFVGAALGNTVAQALDMPLALAAGLGMAAVFASAANAPLALAVMAVELMGQHALPHAVIVCVAAYLLSGHRGIYPAQRIERGKLGEELSRPKALRDWHVR